MNTIPFLEAEWIPLQSCLEMPDKKWKKKMQVIKQKCIFLQKFPTCFSFKEINKTSGSLFSDQLLVTFGGLLLLGPAPVGFCFL